MKSVERFISFNTHTAFKDSQTQIHGGRTYKFPEMQCKTMRQR